MSTGVLASYEHLDSTVEAIEGLRKAGFRPNAYMPYPDHEIEHALGYDQSPVRVWTLVGGLSGAAAGMSLPIFASVDWPLIVGGKPIVAIPAYIVFTFELMVLFGALSTIIGLFVLTRLPDFKSQVLYDPEFTAGRFGVYVEADGSRLDEVRRILKAQEPLELREGPAGSAVRKGAPAHA